MGWLDASNANAANVMKQQQKILIPKGANILGFCVIYLPQSNHASLCPLKVEEDF